MPFLERWMEDQIGPRALARRLETEAPYLIATLPELPRLIHRRLLEPPAASDEAVRALGEAQRARNRWLAILAALLVLVVVELFVRRG